MNHYDAQVSYRAFRYRIYPDATQESRLREYAGAARYIFNICLEQRRDYWRQAKAAGTPINFTTQCREMTELRANSAWLRDVSRSVCDQALRDLDAAFAAFFRRGAGFPKMRNRDENMAFRVPGREVRITQLNRKWATVEIPKFSPIKFRLTRAIAGKIQNASISCRGGQWVISFACEFADAQPVCGLAPVGIDRGVANTFSLSTSEHYQMPAHVAAATEKRKRAQRTLCRRKKGSARRARQRAVVAKHHAHAASARNHWLHERSTDIARRFGVVTLEKLKVANMTASGTGKRGLNRSILEQGWTAFATMLEYKLEARGGRVEYINPAYTSQSCSECGSVNRESRKSQAVFHCVDCGHAAHADTNAAINILRRSPASVEGVGYGPVEARIGTVLTHRESLAA